MTGIEGIGWPATPRAVGAAPVPFASMLALQEAGGETVEDRAARRHGRDMLAALTDLQRALLRGDGDAAALQRLGELATAVPRATDRRIAATVSAIMVRVRVELARRQI